MLILEVEEAEDVAEMPQANGIGNLLDKESVRSIFITLTAKATTVFLVTNVSSNAVDLTPSIGIVMVN